MKGIIHSSNLSILFIDGNQKVKLKDVGSLETIKHFAKEYNASITQGFLASQFCYDGSDVYIAWLDDVLEVREIANANDMGGDYDFRVFTDPKELRNKIETLNRTNNKSRIEAGYCWDWPPASRGETEIYEILI